MFDTFQKALTDAKNPNYCLTFIKAKYGGFCKLTGIRFEVGDSIANTQIGWVSVKGLEAARLSTFTKDDEDVLRSRVEESAPFDQGTLMRWLEEGAGKKAHRGGMVYLYTKWNKVSTYYATSTGEVRNGKGQKVTEKQLWARTKNAVWMHRIGSQIDW